MVFMSKSKAVQLVNSPNQSWSLRTGWKGGVELFKFHITVGTLEKAKTRLERRAQSAVLSTVKMSFPQGQRQGRMGTLTPGDSRRIRDWPYI